MALVLLYEEKSSQSLKNYEVEIFHQIQIIFY